MLKKISGWGMNTSYKAKILNPNNLTELKNNIKPQCIARGAGRSYGDSSIQPKGTISTLNLNKILKFNKKKGIIEVQSGITINKLLSNIVKEGWFLPVTAGSKFITIGGMVAADVHGKNHHKVGSFRNFILSLAIINEKKKLVKCSKRSNKNLFDYTIGGMGLTGVIYSCKFKLKKIKSDIILKETIKNNNLYQTLRCIKISKTWDYNVAWIDTSAEKKQLGRSIVMRGKFLDKITNKNFSFKKPVNIGYILNILPNFFMNKFVIKILNQIYFLVTTTKKEEISIDKFFYPLDSINNWNKIYGSKGFISYQCSIPFKNSLSVIENILQIIKLNKIYSFVSVLKSMGYNGKYTSFGQKGYTLVFDFPYYYNIEKTLKELDETVHKNNGRIYLCKDSRVLQKKFMKINKEFNKKEFVDLRRSKKFFFNSIQSERLKI